MADKHITMSHDQELLETLLILVIWLGVLLFNENGFLQDLCQMEYGTSQQLVLVHNVKSGAPVSASGWTSSLVIKHLERDSSNILGK